MKAGLLTYHYVCNEGALWQAYALQKAFRKFSPSLELEVANYELPAKSAWNRETFGAGKLMAFETARQSFVHEPISEAELAEFDCLVVGSDIVWQFAANVSAIDNLRASVRAMPRRRNRTTILNRLRGLKHRAVGLAESISPQPPQWKQVPNPYWLPWKSDQKKASYAASIGYSRSDLLKDESRTLMRDLLSDFDLISVRDSHTKAFVEELLERDVVKVPDPAWHYDDRLPNVSECLYALGWDGETPLAGVLYPCGNRYGQELDEWVLEELRAQGFQTVSVIDANPSVDFDLASHLFDPFSWWAVIAQLSFLLTVRTHPNIAALKYHTPFLNLDITSAINAARVSKSEDMLAEFGLERFCLFRHHELTEKCIRPKLREALTANWDWQAIDGQIMLHNKTGAEFIGRIERLVRGDPG